MTLIPKERSYHKEYPCEISKLYHVPFKSYGQSLNFFMKNKTLILGLDLGPSQQRKGIIKWNNHMKYKSSITYQSKVMANVNFLVFFKCDLDI